MKDATFPILDLVGFVPSTSIIGPKKKRMKTIRESIIKLGEDWGNGLKQ